MLAWSRRKPANIFHIKNFPLKLLLQAKLIFNIFQSAVASKVSIRKRSLR
nr:MAG TPA: hypothetical protein [Caudoviricetes sp.]